MTVYEISGAYRNINARGRGTEAFRKALRGGRWDWVAAGYLPRGTFLAADRRASVTGPVEPGELIAQFSRSVGYGGSRACSLDWFSVVGDDGQLGDDLVCRRRKVAGGGFGYNVTLPDGSVIEVPDPLDRS
jgi:hypothetical protein